jgi:hypothetical protein
MIFPWYQACTGDGGAPLVSEKTLLLTKLLLNSSRFAPLLAGGSLLVSLHGELVSYSQSKNPFNHPLSQLSLCHFEHFLL